MRRSLPEATLRRYCREQLAHLIGSSAATPVRDIVQDWAREPCTTTPRDLNGGILEHPFAPAAAPAPGPWQGRLIGIGSEWSP